MAKKKDLKVQNPDYTIDVIDVLSLNDPSGTNKYLPFMIKQTKEWVEWLHSELEKETFKQMFEVVKDFEDLSNRNLLDNKDIYAYESNADIMEAVKLAKEKVTRSEVKKNETVVIYEDDKWLVLYPLTTRSSNMYGKATKWCVASEDQNFKKYFKQYTENGVLLFLINKTISDKDARNDKLSKVAFHMDRTKGDGLTVWDCQDRQLGIQDFMAVSTMIGGDIMKVINEQLENGETNQEAADKKGLKGQ